MKIAAITVTYNDDYKIKPWAEYFNEYKDEIYLNIIVDNGSRSEYIQTVERLFPESIIIKRTSNDGTTAAYNDGIRHALENSEIDSIMLIGNDIRFPSGNLSILHEILFSKEVYGIITPILLKKDSDIIDDYGSKITKMLYMEPEHTGETLNDSLPITKEVQSVTGGMNLAKREYYEVVGLQDEQLFMYSDEVDMGLRMAQTKFKAVITRKAIAWHQHISPNNSKSRQGYAEFFMRRNKIYLAYKHFGFQRAFYIFFVQMVRAPWMTLSFIKRKVCKNIIYYLLGCICGILRIEKNFEFIVGNKI